MVVFNVMLLSPFSLHHIKCAGAILHPGTLVARLDLDDPSSVYQATLYTQPLPMCKTDKTQGSKVHQVQNMCHNKDSVLLLHVLKHTYTRVPSYHGDNKTNDLYWCII